MKFDKSLCPKCNGDRTQPHDLAWDKLSATLHDPSFEVRPGRVIYLRKVFGKTVLADMRSIQLFFVKLFGCHVVEQKLPIDLESFARAITDNRAHPRVYLSIFEPSPNESDRGIFSMKISPVTNSQTGQIVGAGWMYGLDRFSVQFLYAEPGYKPDGLKDSWQPKFSRTMITISALS